MPEYYGVNQEEERRCKPLDLWCPMCGGTPDTPNYSKLRCEWRQKDKTQEFCFGGCKGHKYAKQGQQRQAQTLGVRKPKNGANSRKGHKKEQV